MAETAGWWNPEGSAEGGAGYLMMQLLVVGVVLTIAVLVGIVIFAFRENRGALIVRPQPRTTPPPWAAAPEADAPAAPPAAPAAPEAAPAEASQASVQAPEAPEETVPVPAVPAADAAAPGDPAAGRPAAAETAASSAVPEAGSPQPVPHGAAPQAVASHVASQAAAVQTVTEEAPAEETSAGEAPEEDAGTRPAAPAAPVPAGPADPGSPDEAPTQPLRSLSGPLRLPMLRFEAAGRTNGGDHGPNADTYLIQDRLLVVADGVSRATASRRASALAAAAVAVERPQDAADPVTAAGASAITANEVLLRTGQERPELAGMATTLDIVALAEVAGEWHLVVAHVGNAIVLLCPPDGEPRLLTRPHAFGKGPLLRAVGAEETLHPDVDAVPVRPGAVVVMATDGLTDVLSTEEIAAAVRWHAGDPPQACADALLRAAYERATKDDTTVVVARVTEAESYLWSASK